MKLAINMIRMDLTELIQSTPSLCEELNIIFQLNSNQLNNSCLESLTLDIVEQVIERPMLGWIRRQVQASPERALLGVVNEDHVVAIPLSSVTLAVSNLIGLAELLQLSETILYPVVEIMVGTCLLFEGDFELITTDQKLEPTLLEAVDVIVVPHSVKSMTKEWKLMEDRTSIFSKKTGHVEEHLALHDNLSNRSSTALKVVELYSIEVGMNFGKSLIKGLYLPINDMTTVIDDLEHDQIGFLALSMPVDNEPNSSEIILCSVGGSSEMLAWK